MAQSIRTILLLNAHRSHRLICVNNIHLRSYATSVAAKSVPVEDPVKVSEVRDDISTLAGLVRKNHQRTFAERLKRALDTTKRDFAMLGVFANIRKSFWQYRRNGETVGSLMHKTAVQYPNKTALVCASSGRSFTFKQLDEFANQVANYFSALPKSEAKVTALFGGSSVEYVGIWLGLSRARRTIALINSNLVAESLANSLKVAKPNEIVVDLDLQQTFETVKDQFPDCDVIYYSSRNLETFGNNSKLSSEKLLNNLIQKQSAEYSISSGKSLTSADVSALDEGSKSSKVITPLEEVLFYIYTSGTTGPPKSCIILQRRFLGFTKIIQLCVGIKSSDVIYCPLPLYHTAGGVATLGQSLINGSTVVFRNKFSASHFWNDIVKYKCTAAQYIGEICRFLLAQPSSPLERQHTLKLIYGQGLRPSIWKEFHERFGVEKIVEMYGSTEGNSGLANMFGRTGAVGYLSPFLHTLHPQVIVRVDRETEEVLRDSKGRCSKISPGEEGELLGQISWDPLKKFDGYTNKDATRKKILTDVFRPGDKYARTGDIMTMDDEGFVYFVDRLGDAYRWKGENVSSSEVETIISSLNNHSNCAVYAVTVPGVEGKAGMACISPESEDGISTAEFSEEKIKNFANKLSRHLPSYALPVFLRITSPSSIQLTGTFRIQKNQLKNQGYDPSKVGQDKLFYLETISGKNESKSFQYKELTSDIFQRIKDGKIRF